MVFGEAKKRPTIGRRIKESKREEQKLYNFMRRSQGPTGRQVSVFSGGGANVQQGASEGAFLQTAGDTMMGPIAFFPRLVTISAGQIDIGKTTDAFSSRIIVSPQSGSTDDLDTILNAEHNGQLLFLQGIQTDTITLTNSGNIETIDGNNFDIVDDDIIILQFDVTDNKWQQVTTGKGFLGASQTPWLTDIDADGFDLQDLSNIEFRTTTGTPVAGTPSIHVDASGDMVFDLDAADGYFWEFGQASKLSLSIISTNPHFILTGIDNETPVMRVIRIDSTPALGASVGRFEFYGVDSSGTTQEEFARIQVDSEDLTVGSVDGSMHLQVDKNNLTQTFLSLNNSNDNAITAFRNLRFDTARDIEMVTNDIWLDEVADATRVFGTATALSFDVGGTFVGSFSSSAFSLQGSTTLSIAELFAMTATGATGVVDGTMWHDSGTGDILYRSGGVERNLSNVSPPFSDATAIVEDNGDPTKLFQIECASIAAGTTSILGTNTLTAGRTWSFPDATGVIALLSVANVFTQNQEVKKTGITTWTGNRNANLSAGQAICRLDAASQDSLGTEDVVFSRIQFAMRDNTSTSKDSDFVFQAMNDNTLTSIMGIRGDILRVVFQANIDVEIDATQKLILDGGAATTTSIRESVSDVIALEVGGVDQYTFSGTNFDINSANLREAQEISFAVGTQKITSSGDGLTFDAPSSDFLRFTPGTTLQVDMDDFFLRIRNTDTSSSPQLVLHHDDSTPVANARVGSILFQGEDSASNQQTYAFIEVESDLVTSGSERGRMTLQVVTGSSGSLQTGMTIEGDASTGILLGFRSALPQAARAWTDSGTTVLRTISDSSTTANVRDALNTLIGDLEGMGILG